MSQQLPILIIGGGPTGLAAALTLTQNNVPVRIVDKAVAFHQSARGSGIQPRSMELFRFLGVADDLRRRGGHARPMRSYKLPGGTEPERTWSLSEEITPTSDRPTDKLLISQYLTEGVLREHLAKLGIYVELRTEPTAIDQDADGVTVTLKKNTPEGTEETETVKAAYVIGADGAKGFTRHAIGAHYVGEVKEAESHVLAEVELEGLSDDYWHTWNVPGQAMVVTRPTEDPHVFFNAIMTYNKDIDTISLSQNFDKFVAFFHEFTGRTDVVYKKCHSLTLWQPKMMKADKFQEGRVFIAGDAAHIHSPTGGQGLNTSVQDAINLSWKLALAYKGLASPALLSTYSLERIPVVAEMLRITTALYARLTSGGPQGLSWGNFVRMLDVNYRWSPLLLDARGPPALDDDALKARAYTGYPGEDVRAGDRAPDAPGLVGAQGEVVALFDLFKTYHHTVLVFSPGHEDVGVAEGVVRAAEALGSGIARTAVIARDGVPRAIAGAAAYHDKEGLAYRTYGIAGETAKIVVVRPDAYVGAFVEDVDGLRAYFAKVLSL